MSSARDDEDPREPTPEERRSLAGNRTMQLDALSDELFEELDRRDAPPPAAAPPPLPRRRRWTAGPVAVLVGVVLVAGALGLLVSFALFGDGSGDGAAPAAPRPGEPETGGPGEEEPVHVVPLQLDPVVIESGEADPPAE